MNITKDNFEIVLPHFKALLATCDFYAIDMEMTGIRFNDQPPLPHPMMTPEEEFPINFAVAKKFSPIQLGVCLFHSIPDSGKSSAVKEICPVTVDSIEDPDLRKTFLGIAKKLAELRGNIATTGITSTVPAAVEADLTKLQTEFFALVKEHFSAAPAATKDATAAPEGTPPQQDGHKVVMNLLGEFAIAANDVKRKNKEADGAQSALIDPTVAQSEVLKDSLGTVTGQFEARPFNFYIFPAEQGDMCMDRDTVSQFLVKHGMDFQTWIAKGIPYISMEKAKEIRVAAFANQMARAGRSKPQFNQALLGELPKEDVGAVTDVMVQAEKVATQGDKNWSVRVPYFRSEKSFEAVDQYRKSLGMEFRVSKVKGKTVKELVIPEEASMDATETDQSSATAVLAAAESSLGATLLYEALVDSKKLIVAHNSFKDFLFVYTAFNSTILTKYADFKKYLRTAFPLILDSKTLVNLDCVHDFRMIHFLQREYEYFRDQQKKVGNTHPISVKFPLGFEAFDARMLALPGATAAHDASYDAWMCGCLSLYVRKTLIQQHIPVDPFLNCIPLYGLLLSCQIAFDEDCVCHEGPLVRIQPSGPSQKLEMSRLSGMLNKYDLDGRLCPQYEERVVFVSPGSKGTGSMLESAVEKLQESLDRHFPGSKVSILKFDATVWERQCKSVLQSRKK